MKRGELHAKLTAAEYVLTEHEAQRVITVARRLLKARDEEAAGTPGRFVAMRKREILALDRLIAAGKIPSCTYEVAGENVGVYLPLGGEKLKIQ